MLKSKPYLREKSMAYDRFRRKVGEETPYSEDSCSRLRPDRSLTMMVRPFSSR